MDDVLVEAFRRAQAEPLINQMEIALSKAQALNAERGNEGYLDCPLCNNKGYIAFVDDDYTVFTRECSCMARRRSLRSAKESGMSEMLGIYTLDNYETPAQWQKDIYNKATRFISDPNGWFVISGCPGSGKTHICTAICKALIEAGKETKYFMWREMAPKLKAMVNEREFYEAKIDRFKTADVLYIDAYFKGSVTPADINLAFELLNCRYNSRSKITIISTERTIDEILAIDEALGSRIYERSKGFCVTTPKHSNWRLRK